MVLLVLLAILITLLGAWMLVALFAGSFLLYMGAMLLLLSPLIVLELRAARRQDRQLQAWLERIKAPPRRP
jgi:hypothetical protein